MTPTGSRVLLAKLGLGLIALALGLTGGEATLRTLRPVLHLAPPEELRGHSFRRRLVHQASEVPGLPYELAPGRRVRTRTGFIATNRFGMRDRERELKKTDGSLRIAVIGDSFTFGLGVPGEAAYPAVLERVLNRLSPAGPHYEALNFGVSGYSTRDEALVYEHKVLRWKPDLVVIGYVLNDPEPDPVQPLQAVFHRPLWWQRWHLLRGLALLRRERGLHAAGGDYYRYLHSGAIWEAERATLRRIGRLAGRQRIASVLVIFPAIPLGGWGEYPYGDLHALVARAGRESGLAVLDLQPAFSRFEPRVLRLSRDDRHPTARGHKVAGTRIAKWVARRLQAPLGDLAAGPSPPPVPVQRLERPGRSTGASTGLGGC